MEIDKMEIEGLQIPTAINEISSLDANDLAHKLSVINYRINYLRGLETYDLFNTELREEYEELCDILDDYDTLLKAKRRRDQKEEIKAIEKLNKRKQEPLDIYDDSELKKYKKILKY
jgi:hypothetical protein